VGACPSDRGGGASDHGRKLRFHNGRSNAVSTAAIIAEHWTSIRPKPCYRRLDSIIWLLRINERTLVFFKARLKGPRTQPADNMRGPVRRQVHTGLGLEGIKAQSGEADTAGELATLASLTSPCTNVLVILNPVPVDRAQASQVSMSCGRTCSSSWPLGNRRLKANSFETEASKSRRSLWSGPGRITYGRVRNMSR
jgi:hypothetical protein